MDTAPRIVRNVAHIEPRRADSHKGDFGRVLIVGGSRGMIGAVALAANAAFRGGAGLVTFAAPENIQLTIAGLCPCATSIPLKIDPDGNLSIDAARQVTEAAESADILAIGPGLGTGPAQTEIIRTAISLEKPLVVDADGLNGLAGLDNWPQKRGCPLILTPHPGEFSRLTGASVADIQAGRQTSAVEAVNKWTAAGNCDKPLICLLKGDGTVVTDGQRLYVNDTGNPGMACGGSGDVLTGLVAGLLGQNMSPFKATVLGANRHGRAGDLAAAELGEVSMTAEDILAKLPEAVKESIG